MTARALAPVRSTSARLTEAAPVFAALGDATRLRIVARLCDDGPQSIVRLSSGEDVSRQAITKHLRALEEAGLVQSAREGRERVWELRTQRLAEVRRHLDSISEQWDAAIGRLRALVEDIEESRD
jgi:DNA-binding transcriptional ArsR family regulator